MGEWKSLKIGSGTGWKEIDREAGTGWKALLWDSVSINVGGVCESKEAGMNGAYSYISGNNPANASGTLTSACVWMDSVTAHDVSIATFYQISGDTWKCRAVENIGELSVGINTKNISLAVVTGDCMGWYGGGSVNNAGCRGTTSGKTLYYISENKLVADLQTTFNPVDNNESAVHATG